MKQFYIFALLLFLVFPGNGQCTDPAAPSVTGPANPICAGAFASLTASSSAEAISWFDSPAGGIQVGQGSSFQTALLSTTTSFWAEAQNFSPGTPVSGGGKVAPTSNGGTTIVPVTSPWGLAFTATRIL
ncbi:MAG TPA: hypothetical protein VGB43_08985 [Flavobacterium sp.]